MPTDRYRAFATSTLIVVIALSILVGIFAPLTIFVLPAKTTVGQVYLKWLMGESKSGLAPSVPTEGFIEGAPIWIAEMEALGDSYAEHSVIVDIGPRLQEIYEQPPDLIAFLQYKNYLYLRFMGTDEQWNLFVYRWTPDTEWEFVEHICETC